MVLTILRGVACAPKLSLKKLAPMYLSNLIVTHFSEREHVIFKRSYYCTHLKFRAYEFYKLPHNNSFAIRPFSLIFVMGVQSKKREMPVSIREPPYFLRYTKVSSL